jgi:hypothetical protein
VHAVDHVNDVVEAGEGFGEGGSYKDAARAAGRRPQRILELLGR